MLFRPLLDFIFPPVCHLCNELLRDGGKVLCGACRSLFVSVDERHPVWLSLSARLREDGPVEGLLSCYVFEKKGKLQEAMHLLKYRGITSLGVAFGEEIGNHMLRSGQFRGADVLIPVPLHKSKQRERGYNQCECICRGISHVTGIPLVTGALLRSRNTASQTSLRHDERKANVGGAFRVRKPRAPDIAGKKCILVDDVITTGSTLSACAGVLRANGASKIFAASAAIAE